MRAPLVIAMHVIILTGCSRVSEEERAATIAAFATVEEVFQHPRCANCHVPGDTPGAGWVHPQAVARGADGHGAPGLPCATCHAEQNPPASFGPQAPPGAPHWGLPPPDQKMAWFGLNSKQLCEMIKDKNQNGGRELAAVTTHVSEDKLVLWGWNPGGDREPVSVPHAEFVAKFKQWVNAGGPCPG